MTLHHTLQLSRAGKTTLALLALFVLLGIGATAPVAHAGKIAAGPSRTCAVTGDGTVRCWDASTLRPATVHGLTGVTALAAGVGHTCALRNDGTAACWGRNESGQLGNNTFTQSTRPVAVRGLNDAIAIAAGNAHSCALRTNGSVVCWGNNSNGELGNGKGGRTVSAANRRSPVPVPVADLGNATSLTAGGSHTCVLHSNGAAACWGINAYGQLGDGNSRKREGDVPPITSRPVAVKGLGPATQISAGTNHTCAVLADATAACWGHDGDMQLGNPPAVRNTGAGRHSTVPVPVLTLTDVTWIAAGTFHTCAVRTTGEVLCWGDNEFGQIGNGNGGIVESNVSDRARAPATVVGLTGAVEVTLGTHHTCAMRSDTSMACWGRNDNGQLGNGTRQASWLPVEPGSTGPVPGGSPTPAPSQNT